jgi:hypothetical protein
VSVASDRILRLKGSPGPFLRNRLSSLWILE